jgi:hypothetical protein
VEESSGFRREKQVVDLGKTAKAFAVWDSPADLGERRKKVVGLKLFLPCRGVQWTWGDISR